MTRVLLLLAVGFACGAGAARKTPYAASTRASAIQCRSERNMHLELERYRRQFLSGDERRRDELQHELWHTQFIMAEEMRAKVNDYLKLKAADELSAAVLERNRRVDATNDRLERIERRMDKIEDLRLKP